MLTRTVAPSTPPNPAIKPFRKAIFQLRCWLAKRWISTVKSEIACNSCSSRSEFIASQQPEVFVEPLDTRTSLYTTHWYCVRGKGCKWTFDPSQLESRNSWRTNP